MDNNAWQVQEQNEEQIPKPVIEIQSAFDVAHIQAYGKYSLKKQTKTFCLLIILGSILAVAGFLMQHFLETSAETTIGLVIAVFGIFGVLYSILILVMLIRFNSPVNLQNSNALISPKTKKTIKFGIDSVIIEVYKENEFQSNTFCGYSILKQVVETKTHFFVFVAANQAHIVPKTDFAVGTPQELTDFLKSKLKSKFKREGVK